MSVAAPSPAASLPGPSPAPAVDTACPLCGAPLDQAQDWCLACGGAARTRLAAPTKWKGPVVAIAVVGALALGVLASALVKVSGGRGATRTPAPVTTTIPAAAGLGSVPTTAGGALPATPATPGTPTTPGTPGTPATPATPGTPTTVTPNTTSVPTGAVNPGTPTTLTPGSATPSNRGATTPAPTATGTTPSPSAEEALRKAGFQPRTGR